MDAKLAASLSTLLGELVDGPPAGNCFILNPGDVGLLRSLDKLNAAAASKSANGGATIAAHVDHLRYGFSLMNRWFDGENPWGAADGSKSWKISKVSDAEWKQLRAGLASELESLQTALRKPREMNETELNIVIGVVVHLGYHIGAIRQIDSAARGPRE